MKNTRQQGFTLIELMVAATIGLVIISGVMTLLTTSKRTYSFQQQMARLQENARFAFDFIGRDLRMAGYFGCARGTLFNPNPSASSSPVIPIASVRGIDSHPNSINVSDVFMVAYLETDRNAFRVVHCPRDPLDPTIRRQGAGGSQCGNPVSAYTATPLTQGLGTSASPIVLGPNLFHAQRGDLIANADILLGAADCRRTDLYRIYEITDTSLSLSYPNRTTPASDGLVRDYDNGSRTYGAELRQLVTRRFFIANNPEGEPALYRDNGIYRQAATGGTPPCPIPSTNPIMPAINATLNTDNCYAEELVEGVESMQLRWGVDTSGDYVPNIYRRSDQVTNWSQVVSAEISLLMRTSERFDREADIRDYSVEMDPDLSADTLKFDDFRRRVLFRTVIELRNLMVVK
jgi:type IV pilus assembly protein PilW